jgi:hypothetical protein
VVRLALVLALALAAAPAPAAVVEMRVEGTARSGISSGVQPCTVIWGQTVVVTWHLDQQTLLNGYDLELRWNPDELTLLDAAPLHPDTGTPTPFSEAPGDPADSRAFAIVFTAENTTDLFQVSFEAHPSLAATGSDLLWFPNANGLSPGSVVLENSAGAAIDFQRFPEPEVPGLGGLGLALLAGSVAVVARRQLSRVTAG